MSVGSPGCAVQGGELDIVSEAMLGIDDMFEDEACIDDIPGIGSSSPVLSGYGISIEDGGADSEWLKILACHDALGNAIFSESRARESTER